ncbi:hypothetical protein ACQY1Q_06015 [Tenacibaculum sp. TC6]|uniref:hypothetical protein n=1 Tax=Tenacibaculum sp. TC6 TaxID=3423223 RepID=UPI003D3618A1
MNIITQNQENGNIVISDQGGIKLITSSINVHQHPRNKDWLLINDSLIPLEEKGLSIPISNLTINGVKDFNNIEEVKNTFYSSISLNKGGSNRPIDPKENDPYWKVYQDQNTYEKLLLFAEMNVMGSPTINNDRDGKLVTKEYYCQFTSFFIRITLNYYYLINDPTKISHILMSGHTSYVTLPLKAYHYDVNGDITYSYEIFSWQR